MLYLGEVVWVKMNQTTFVWIYTETQKHSPFY